MKQIKSILAALTILIAASSCSKETGIIIPPVPAANAKLVKVEELGTNFSQKFSYNTNGRLLNIKSGNFETRYTYPAGSVGLEMYENGNVKFADFINIVIANNKMTAYDFRMFNDAGQPYTPETNTSQFDAAGYRVKHSYSNHVYEYTIVNGNTVSVKETITSSGVVNNTILEYYTDKPNNLNINFFENWTLDQYVFDQDIAGKKNANLPKKITDNSGVSELSYIMNSVGLPEQMKIKFTPTNGAQEFSTYKLTYQ